MPHFDWTVNVGNIVTVIIVLLGMVKTVHKTTQVAALRDQKIDIILFGPVGEDGGLMRDVKNLKRDMYHNNGTVPRMRRVIMRHIADDPELRA